jgi:hypothetical protein
MITVCTHCHRMFDSSEANESDHHCHECAIAYAQILLECAQLADPALAWREAMDSLSRLHRRRGRVS